MNKTANKSAAGQFLTIKQAQEVFNMGTATIKRLADECGASVKIGKLYRVNVPRLSSYIMETYTV